LKVCIRPFKACLYTYRLVHPEPGSGFEVQYRWKRTQSWMCKATFDTFDDALQFLAVLSYGRSLEQICEALQVPNPRMGEVRS
jgi:hypothetical protein